MKICYDNLEKFSYNQETGYFTKNSIKHIYKEKCKICNEPFLARKTYNDKLGISDFCCKACANVYKSRDPKIKAKIIKANTGQKRTIKVRQKMSKIKLDKNNPNFKGGVKKLNIPLYDTYGAQLLVFGEVRIHMLLANGTVYKSLQVPCHNSSCEKWFVPTQTRVRNRLQAFNGTTSGEQNFYCSPECKISCSTFGQKAYRKGENPNNKYTCVKANELSIWSKEVLKRAKYKCAICGKKAKHGHHVEPKILYPEWALDPDNGIAVCEECHRWLHTGDCSPYKLHERHQEKLLQESVRPVKERAPPI